MSSAVHSRLFRVPAWLLGSVCLVLSLGFLIPLRAAYPLSTTDKLGRALALKAAPRRIISLSPSNTEILFALGAGPRVVAVTSFCNYPSEASALPKVGGFSLRTISLETIVSLQPDLIFAGDENHKPIVEQLAAMGIPCYMTKARTYEDVYSTILAFGELCDLSPAAQGIVEDMRRRVAQVQERVASWPQETRPKVYWEVFDDPLMSAGPRSFIGQSIAMAGGRNIFDDVAEEYPQISMEAVVARAPDLIIGPASMRTRVLTPEILSTRPGWKTLPALMYKRLHIIPDEPVARPGPRLVIGLEQIARFIEEARGAGPVPALPTPVK